MLGNNEWPVRVRSRSRSRSSIILTPANTLACSESNDIFY